jgi:hypothetical protein
VPCKGRGSECTEQRRENSQNASENSKANLKGRVAKLEAIILASGLGEPDVVDFQGPPTAADNPKGSSPSAEKGTPKSTDSNVDKATPDSSSHRSASAAVDTDSPHDIDPIVTLFNNAIVSQIEFICNLSAADGDSIVAPKQP